MLSIQSSNFSLRCAEEIPCEMNAKEKAFDFIDLFIFRQGSQHGKEGLVKTFNLTVALRMVEGSSWMMNSA